MRDMTHRNLLNIRTTCFVGVTVIASNTDLEMASHLAAHIASSLLLNGGYLWTNALCTNAPLFDFFKEEVAGIQQ